MSKIKVMTIEALDQKITQTPEDGIELIKAFIETFVEEFPGVRMSFHATLSFMDKEKFEKLPEFTGF